MKFRTEITPEESPWKITHSDQLVMMGSCFSEHIGDLLLRYRFRTAINSHGILFNPESIAASLEHCMDSKNFVADDLLHVGDRYVSLEHHGRFSGSAVQDVLAGINESVRHFHARLKQAKVLFITLGSAHAYRHKTLDKIVANCHKIPQSNFDKTLLQPEQIIARFQKLLPQLKRFNSQLQIVFTVSPVRHWRDGAVQNQLSKAHLLTAIHRLIGEFAFCSYFPAYELVMDDLRDYRFFEQDMIHPNKQAVAYVWEKLCACYLDAPTLEKMKQMEPLIRFTEHRNSHPNDPDYLKMLEKNNQAIEAILGHSI